MRFGLIAGIGLLAAFASVSAVADQNGGGSGASWFKQFIALDEDARIINVDYFHPIQQDRDIRVESVDFARAWRSVNGLEFQWRVGLFHSNGSRQDVAFMEPPNSTMFGVSGGGVIRLYPIEFWWQSPRGHFFLQYSEHILWTGRHNSQFPAGGTGLNGFARWGWGVSYDFTPRLTLEATYLHGHVSNGSGLTPQNPMWNGKGGGLAVRFRF